MKKITLIIAGIALFFNISQAQDKAFHKGAITVDAGIGIAVYGTKTHQEFDGQVWNGSKVVTERFKKDTTDAAAATIIPITVEYGINDWLGIGVRFGYSKYIANGDSTNNNIKPTARGFDGDLVLNFHFIKTKRFDMPLSLTLGYSHFKYSANDPNNSVAKDNGLNYGIALVPRIYFGDHIGMFFNLGYMGYSYPSMLFSNNSDSNINNNNNELYKLKGNGGTIGIGLVIKL